MKRQASTNGFGKRLASLRKARGLTQQQLGEQAGVSKRVIAYYEGETNYPPTHLILPLSKALNVTPDELLGVKQTKEIVDPGFAALWRRLKVLETFSEKERKAVLQYVDFIAEKNKAQQRSAKQKATD
jgi:transcriptional regulator with XRE-family HTH domain